MTSYGWMMKENEQSVDSLELTRNEIDKNFGY